MKGLRLILLGYCLLAALSGSVLTLVFGSALARSSAVVRHQAEILESTKQNFQDAQAYALRQRETQRMGRDNFTPEQAIEASTEAQAAIAEEQRLEAQLDSDQKLLDSQRKTLAQHQTRLVPLIALTIFHWLLVPLVYRRRE